MKAYKNFHRRLRGQRITAIMSRDGVVCALCPRNLDRHVKDPLSHDYVTFDHIVPRSRGGLDTVDNVRLAHRRCNELRGNDPTMPEEETDAATRKAR